MFARFYEVIRGDAWYILKYLYHVVNLQKTHTVQRRRTSAETTTNLSLPSIFMNVVLSKHCMDSGLLFIVIIDIGHHHNVHDKKKKSLMDLIHDVWILARLFGMILRDYCNLNHWTKNNMWNSDNALNKIKLARVCVCYCIVFAINGDKTLNLHELFWDDRKHQENTNQCGTGPSIKKILIVSGHGCCNAKQTIRKLRKIYHVFIVFFFIWGCCFLIWKYAWLKYDDPGHVCIS